MVATYNLGSVYKTCFENVNSEQVGITRNSAASLCHGSPRLCNEYLLFRFPNLS